MIKGMGWRADNPDMRDHIFQPMLLATATMAPRPKLVSLRSRMPGIYDQGQIGSCTGNALAAAIEFDLRKQSIKEFVPSRLMAYYNARFLEGATASDAGASIRDVVKAAVKWGICSESPQPNMAEVWPYDEREVLIRPRVPCYEAAKKTLVKNYARVDQNLDAICGTLAQGFPVIFGAALYESFDSDAVARTGKVPMPGTNEKAIGGHATLLCGYDDGRYVFIDRNSWGKSWGEQGYCEFPYSYILDNNLCDDFWVINTVGA